jgi:cytochrome c oxidase subunit 4
MSALTTPADSPEIDLHADQEHAHPTQLFYIKIAAILAVLTGLEVGASYWEPLEDNNSLLLAVLIPMMIVKFAIVALYFMHLKFDSRWFRWLLVTGIVLAVSVYAIVFATFQFESIQDHVNL